VASYSADLTRAGPGLLYGDVLTDGDPQIGAVIKVLGALDADVLLLTGIDYDHDLVALTALNARLGPLAYPHLFALPPNTGVATGLDLDGNGRLGEPRDAQGYGRFTGEGAMAILSRLPIDAAGVQDYSGLLWRDLPGTIQPQDEPPLVRDLQRLSTTGHWQVPLQLPSGGRLTLLAWAATPPVFDGPEDRNGRRNHDEAAFWRLLFAGQVGTPPQGPFVLLGVGNLDPTDGEGLRDGMQGLLSDPAIQDPLPKGTHTRTEPEQAGDPLLDTALFDKGVGGLRVDLVLPSADLSVVASGVLWPPDSDPLSADLALASRHRPVWVDIVLP
jgi:Endonuclease/Exonuclease/phosphatase family